MKLIVGLGNPGPSYTRHRHNIGFHIVAELARRNDISMGKKLFQATTGAGVLAGEKVLLVLPETYMNLSGEAVVEVKKYFKVDVEEIIVVHDDIDLDLGRLKFSRGSGHGGHNGIRSIIEHLGTKDFLRLKIGVGRPPQGVDPSDYVLSPFEKEESALVAECVDQGAKGLESLIEYGIAYAQQKYH